MSKKLYTIFAEVLVATLVLSACAQATVTPTTAPTTAPTTEVPTVVSATAVPAQALVIGALWLDASEFYTGVKAGIVAEAPKAGIKLTLLDSNSNGDVSTEADQLQTLIGAKANAIIISAVSTTASVALIKQAHDAGIPVICYNSCINTDDAQKYVYTYVTGDQHQQGVDVGKAMGEYFVAAGITAPKIGVVGCEQYGVCQDRIKGFTEEMTKLVPGAKIVDDQQALEVDKAAEVATNMLTANPDIAGFYCEAGNMI